MPKYWPTINTAWRTPLTHTRLSSAEEDLSWKDRFSPVYLRKLFLSSTQKPCEYQKWFIWSKLPAALICLCFIFRNFHFLLAKWRRYHVAGRCFLRTHSDAVQTNLLNNFYLQILFCETFFGCTVEPMFWIMLKKMNALSKW